MLPRRCLQLPLLSQQRLPASVQLLPLALELGQPDHLDQIGVQEALLLALELLPCLAHRRLPRL